MMNDFFRRQVLLCFASAFILLQAEALSVTDSKQRTSLPLPQQQISRRNALVTAVGSSSVAFSLLISPALPAPAYAQDNALASPLPLTVVPKTQSVLVLGANGGTGRECVIQALQANRPCIATTRSGTFFANDDGSTATSSSSSPSITASPLLQTAACDVRSMDMLRKVISDYKPGAVIFAASASSKKDLNAKDIDCDGVINVAKVCLELGVPRYVVVSSGTVTRPDSFVYQLLNTVGSGIMEAKIAGEDAVRELYKEPSVLQKGLGYTIIRPGGLTDGEPVEASLLELNQGDTKSGRLSRASVAELCIKCLDSVHAWDTTFECYEKDTAKPIESIGLSNILKLRNPTKAQSGFERQGDTWESLLQGLERDSGHATNV